MKEYNGTIYRPPVEAETYLLPVTEGCTHNACRFCSMYKGIPFKVITLCDVEEYLDTTVPLYRRMGIDLSRIYLLGADPFALSFNKLKERIELIKAYVPECETITMYAAVRNIMTKSDDELRQLKQMGVDDLYVGIESGLDDVLENLNKGNTLEDARVQSLRLLEAGIQHRDMLMHGLIGHVRKAPFTLSEEADDAMWVPAEETINLSSPDSPGNALYGLYKIFMQDQKGECDNRKNNL